MKTISEEKFRKHLNQKNSDELVEELVELFNSLEEVRCKYTVRLNPKVEVKEYEKIMKKVNRYFKSLSRGRRIPYSEMIQELNYFEDISQDKELSADLHIKFVENGVDFISGIGIGDTSVYDEIVEVFHKGLRIVSANKLTDQYKSVCNELLYKVDDYEYDFYEEMRNLVGDYVGLEDE